MKRRFGGRSVSVRACQVFGVVILLSALPQTAMATSIAYVKLQNCGDLILQNPNSAGGTNTGIITTGSCAATGAVASGSADFSTDSIDLDFTSIAGRGLAGLAYLDDHLTFHIAGGWSAPVGVHMAGDWGGTATAFTVGFDLGFGSHFIQEHGYSTNYDDGISHSFTSTTTGGVVTGSYQYDALWTVFDGQTVEFLAGLRIEVSGPASAYIHDPLIITLPAGVTFTSDSGSTYSPADTTPSTVPEPSTCLLLGSGLVAVVRRRFKRY
jgi:hypothetical protein